VRLGIGNAGSVTPVLTASSNGKIGVGVTPTNYPDTFNVVGSSHCDKFFHNRIASSVSNSDRGLLFSIDGVQHGRIYVPNGRSLTFQAGTPGSLTDLMSFTQTSEIGIGITNPGYKLHISDSGGTIGHQLTSNSNTIRYTNTNTTAEWSAGTSSPGIANAGNYYSITQFGTDSTWRERLVIDSNGNVNVKDGNLVIGTSGKGIDFSATANGSGTTTSELLDDYETGTWTPTLLGGSSNPTITYTYQDGWYTKIGNIIYINLILTTSVATGGSGQLLIGGLPFSPNTSGYYQIHRLHVGEAQSMTTPITSALIMEEVTTTAIFTDVLTTALQNGVNGNRIRINGWYKTA
jgi:hypothetical protein